MANEIGLRIVLLGAAEFRRSVSTVRGDISGLEKSIRGVSGSAAGIGTALNSAGSAIAGFGRSMSLFVTAPLLLVGGGMLRAGIEFEEAFAGVGKTVDGVSVGFRDFIKTTDEGQQMFREYLDSLGPLSVYDFDSLLTGFILDMDDATKQAILAAPAFGQLTEMGKELRQDFINLSLDLPIATNEIARVGMVAGQLGVQADQLGEFTRVASMMGIATEMSAEDAAFALARFANIFGVESSKMGEYALQVGSAVTHLGNNVAATEPEIVNMALRLASAGRSFGLTEQEVLGISASLTALNVKAERGGTAVSRVLQEMLIAGAEGGDKVQNFASIMGISVAEFTKQMEDAPLDTLKLFMVEMGDAMKNGSGGAYDLAAAMTDVGVGGVRAQDVVRLLNLTMDELETNILLANQAWDEQIALEEEVAKRKITVQSQIQLLKNAFTALSIAIFDLYKDDITKLIKGLGDLVKRFTKLEEPVKRAIVLIAAIAAAIGPALVAFGLFLQTAGTSITFFAGLGTSLMRIIPLFAGLAPVVLPAAAAAGLVYLAFKQNLGGLADIFDNFISEFNTYVLPNLKAAWEAFKVGDMTAAQEWLRLAGLNLKLTLKSVLGDDVAAELDKLSEWYKTDILPKINTIKDDLKEGIDGFVLALEGIDASKALEVLAKIGGGVFSLALKVVGWVASGAKTELPLIGEAIAAFVNMIPLAVAGDGEGAMFQLASGLDRLAQTDFAKFLLGEYAVGNFRNQLALLIDPVVLESLKKNIDKFKAEVEPRIENIKNSLVTALEGFRDAVGEVDLVKAFAAIGKVAGIVTVLAIVVAEWVAGELETILPNIGTVIGDLVGGLSDLVLGDTAEGLEKLASALAAFAQLPFLELAGVGLAFGFLSTRLTSLATAVVAWGKTPKGLLFLGLFLKVIQSITDSNSGFNLAVSAYEKDTGKLATTLDKINIGLTEIPLDIIQSFSEKISRLGAAGIAAGIGLAIFGLVLAGITLPIWLIALGVIALVAGVAYLITHWEDVKEAIENIDWSKLRQDITDFIAKNDELIQSITTVLLGLGAIFLLVMFGIPVGIAVLLIALGLLLAKFVHENWDKFIQFLHDAWDWLENWISPAVDWFKEQLKQLKISPEWQQFINVLNRIYDAAKLAYDMVSWLHGLLGGGGSPVTSEGTLPGEVTGRAPVPDSHGVLRDWWGQPLDFVPGGGSWRIGQVAVAGNAGGGPVFSGQPGIVGEKGWELFWPAMNGYIMTHNDSKSLLRLLSQQVSSERGLARIMTNPFSAWGNQNNYSSVYSPNFYTEPSQPLMSANRSMYADWLNAQQRG